MVPLWLERRSRMAPLSCACCDRCICGLISLYRAWVQVVWFCQCRTSFLSVIVLMKILSGQGMVEVLRLTVLIFLANSHSRLTFSLISALDFQPLYLKIYGVPIYSRLHSGFMSEVWFLAFFPRLFLIFCPSAFFILDLHTSHDHCWKIRCYSNSSGALATVLLAYSDGRSQLIWNESSHSSPFRRG